MTESLLPIAFFPALESIKLGGTCPYETWFKVIKLKTTELTSQIAVPRSAGGFPRVAIHTGLVQYIDIIKNSLIRSHPSQEFKAFIELWRKCPMVGKCGLFCLYLLYLLSSQVEDIDVKSSGKLSYSPFNPNVHLGNFQRTCLDFYKLTTEIAVSPGLI